jgi:hypothetical protein
MNADVKTPRAIGFLCALFLMCVVCSAGYSGLRVVEWSYREAFSTMQVDTIQNASHVDIVPLSSNTVVEQRLKCLADGLTSIQIQTVDWGKDPAPYRCDWSLHAADNPQGEPIRKGAFTADMASDWQFVKLHFDSIHDSLNRTYLVRISAGDAHGDLAGFPCFRPEFPGNSARVLIGGMPSPSDVADGRSLNVRLEYRKEPLNRQTADRSHRHRDETMH